MDLNKILDIARDIDTRKAQAQAEYDAQRRAEREYQEARACVRMIQRGEVVTSYQVIGRDGEIITRQYQFGTRQGAERYISKQDLPSARIRSRIQI
jgi:hypothetical protein